MTSTRNALLVRDDATIESIFRENNRFHDTFDQLTGLISGAILEECHLSSNHHVRQFRI